MSKGLDLSTQPVNEVSTLPSLLLVSAETKKVKVRNKKAITSKGVDLRPPSVNEVTTLPSLLFYFFSAQKSESGSIESESGESKSLSEQRS